MKSMFSVLAIVVMSSIWTGFQSQADDQFAERLVFAARERTQHNVRYDGSYQTIGYPNGDVASDVGVCTDLIIRAYRQLGVDLQQKVHEDMKENFNMYPALWGLSRPDSNIDHRRVPNLQIFFSRQGESLPVSDSADDYLAGDIVTWVLPGNLPHIGIVSDQPLASEPNLIIHNVGSGPVLEPFLFRYPVTGHYRYGARE